MTTPFGVQASGYVIKTQTDILASLISRAKASSALGPNIDYSSASPIGQLLGLIAGELAEVYEVDEATYASNDPEAAVGVPLDNVCSITGTRRPDASASRSLSQTVNLDAGVTLLRANAFISPAGRPDVLFQLDQASVTNSLGTPADVACTFTCTIDGAVSVDAGILSVIASPQVGWNSTTNAQDIVPGRAVGSDQETRALRTVELFTRGGSTVGAIRSHVQAVAGVDTVVVLENTGDVPDANGVPPHAFTAVIDDGAVPAADDNAVGQALYDTRPAGIPSDGDVLGTATDPTDNSEHAEHFRRDERKNVYLDLTLTVSRSFPVDGLQQVKDALKSRGDTLVVGEDVVALFLRAACFAVAGVVDVPTFKLDFTPSPTNTANLPITTYQRATFDTSRITVAVP
jgi:uncharacterized phage protein gp47/JayE